MIKDIQRTTLAAEINRVITDGNKPVYCRWELQIHANNKVYRPYFIETVSSLKDYTGNFYEELTVRAAFNAADVSHGIMPYNNKLEATLRKVPMAGAYSISKGRSETIKGQRYNAYLFDNGSSLVESNKYGPNFTAIADRMDLVVLEIQLVDKVVERMRAHTFSTTVKQCTGMDACSTILDAVTRDLCNLESVGYRGVDVASGYSTKTLQQIVFGIDTKLVGETRSVPRICNESQGGVYSQGLAYHYQDQMWYLFPPFATDRYERSDSTLTIINVPADRYPAVERTYRRTANQLVVLSTGEAKHIDLSIQQQANEGNGVRFIDANKVMGNFVNVKDGKLHFNGSNNLNEFMVAPRDNGPDIIGSGAHGGITVGYSNEFAKLAARNGNYVQLTWENSNPSLIYPGMPVRFMYLIKDLPYEIMGSVVSLQSIDQPINADINNRVFSSYSVITIFIDQVQNPPKRLES